jgi:hypothetical protein
MEKTLRVECFDCSRSPARPLGEKRIEGTMGIVLDGEKIYPKDYSPKLVFFNLFSFEDGKHVLNFTEAMEISLRRSDGAVCFHFKNGVIDKGEEEFARKGYLQKKENCLPKKENWQIILDDVLADAEIGGKLLGEIYLGTFKVNFSYD